MKPGSTEVANDPFANRVLDYINTQLEEESKVILENHMEKVREEIEAKRSEIVLAAGLRLTKSVSMEYSRDELRITIVDRRGDAEN